MPDQLKASEVNSKTDPSVAKQYDDETPKDQQIKQFFEMVDGKKICMLNTYRNGVGTLLSMCPSSSRILPCSFNVNKK
jgi:abnormal spindle-like microcephaly-associated protein